MSEEKPPTKWTPTEIERRGKLAHMKWLQKIGYQPAPPAVEDDEVERDQAANPLEETLKRTPYGQQMLGLLGEAAMLRLREGLAVELVRGASETLDRLRRALVSTRDDLERQRIAAKIPEAEREVSKWNQALRDYTYRREHTEIDLREGMRAFV